jgi:hypothetical protein
MIDRSCFYPAAFLGLPFTTSSAFLAALLPACSFAFLTALLDRLASCSPCLGFMVLLIPALLNFPLLPPLLFFLESDGLIYTAESPCH